MKKTIATIIIAISFLGAAITEHVIPVSFTLLTYASALSITVLIALTAKFVLKFSRSLAIAIILGVFFIPYAQILVGKIDIFVTDPPPPGITAREIRFFLDKITLTNKEGEEIVIFEGRPEGYKLYPGRNIVRLGALNIPAGTYLPRLTKVYLNRIEADMTLELDKLSEFVYSQIQREVSKFPGDVRRELNVPSKEEIKQDIQSALQRIKEIETENFNIESFSSSEESISFTIIITLPAEGFSPTEEMMKGAPESFFYPGVGGPDLILDIVINEMGLPLSIQPKLKMPPGVPPVNLPATTEMPEMEGLPEPPSFDVRFEIMPHAFEGGPGECTNAIECDEYCKRNPEECVHFCDLNPELCREKPELIAGPGGCIGDEECLAFCQNPDNYATCIEWCLQNTHICGMICERYPDLCYTWCEINEGICKMREEYGATPGPGGCRSESECMSYCQNPDNYAVCAEWCLANLHICGDVCEKHPDLCMSWCEAKPELCEVAPI